MSSAFGGDHPSRPNRKARRYSIVCSSGRSLLDRSTSSSRPSRTRQPFTTRTTPPDATVSGCSRNGWMTRERLSRWRMQSASTTQNNGNRTTLMPAFNAFALPPFFLSTSLTAEFGRYRRAGLFRGKTIAIRLARFHQPERLDHLVAGAVGRAIVDDDDLEIRVVGLEQRLDRGDDRTLLVVGRRGMSPAAGRRGSSTKRDAVFPAVLDDPPAA